MFRRPSQDELAIAGELDVNPLYSSRGKRALGGAVVSLALVGCTYIAECTLGIPSPEEGIAYAIEGGLALASGAAFVFEIRDAFKAIDAYRNIPGQQG